MSNGDSFDLPEYRPSYERLETDYNSGDVFDLPEYRPGYEENFSIKYPSGNSATGWLNSVANILPSVSGIVTSLFGKKTTGTPLSQTTKSPSSQSFLGGLFPQSKTISPVVGSETKTSSSNIFLYLIIGAIILFLIFIKR